MKKQGKSKARRKNEWKEKREACKLMKKEIKTKGYNSHRAGKKERFGRKEKKKYQ